MTKENNERIGFSKDQMIEFLKIFKHNTDTMLDMSAAAYENNKEYMKMEQQLFHEKWKVRYLTRRLREIAPHEALTEEELDAQIKGNQN